MLSKSHNLRSQPRKIYKNEDDSSEYPFIFQTQSNQHHLDQRHKKSKSRDLKKNKEIQNISKNSSSNKQSLNQKSQQNQNQDESDQNGFQQSSQYDAPQTYKKKRIRKNRIKGSPWAIWSQQEDKKLIQLYSVFGNKFYLITSSIQKAYGMKKNYVARKVQSRITSIFKFGLDQIWRIIQRKGKSSMIQNLLNGRAKFVFAQKLLRAKDPQHTMDKHDIMTLSKDPKRLTNCRIQELIQFIQIPVAPKNISTKPRGEYRRKKKFFINRQVKNKNIQQNDYKMKHNNSKQFVLSKKVHFYEMISQQLDNQEEINKITNKKKNCFQYQNNNEVTQQAELLESLTPNFAGGYDFNDQLRFERKADKISMNEKLGSFLRINKNNNNNDKKGLFNFKQTLKFYQNQEKPKSLKQFQFYTNNALDKNSINRQNNLFNTKNNSFQAKQFNNDILNNNLRRINQKQIQKKESQKKYQQRSEQQSEQNSEDQSQTIRFIKDQNQINHYNANQQISQFNKFNIMNPINPYSNFSYPQRTSQHLQHRQAYLNNKFIGNNFDNNNHPKNRFYSNNFNNQFNRNSPYIPNTQRIYPNENLQFNKFIQKPITAYHPIYHQQKQYQYNPRKTYYNNQRAQLQEDQIDNKCFEILYLINLNGNDYHRILDLLQLDNIKKVSKLLQRVYLKTIRAFQKAYKILIDQFHQKMSPEQAKQLSIILAKPDSLSKNISLIQMYTNQIRNKFSLFLILAVNDYHIDASFIEETYQLYYRLLCYHFPQSYSFGDSYQFNKQYLSNTFYANQNKPSYKKQFFLKNNIDFHTQQSSHIQRAQPNNLYQQRLQSQSYKSYSNTQTNNNQNKIEQKSYNMNNANDNDHKLIFVPVSSAKNYTRSMKIKRPFENRLQEKFSQQDLFHNNSRTSRNQYCENSNLKISLEKFKNKSENKSSIQQSSSTVKQYCNLMLQQNASKEENIFQQEGQQ